MRRWLTLAMLVASAICAHAQTLDGVTTSTTAGGSPTPPPVGAPICLLDLSVSTCTSGLN